MTGAAQINLLQFAAVYLLLLVVLAVMRRCGVDQGKLLVVASARMTVQLVVAGLVLAYIFADRNPAWVALYLAAMLAMAIHTVFSRNKGLPRRFQVAVGASLAASTLPVLAFFVCVVVGEKPWDPQYVIPVAGMLVGNAMTATSLGVKTFREALARESSKVETLTNLGAAPKAILKPFVANAFETALLPTLNSMLGMGVVSLPGMMTGQILSGTAPTTAVLYQIAVMVAITCAVCLSAFGALTFGSRTLATARGQVSSL